MLLYGECDNDDVDKEPTPEEIAQWEETQRKRRELMAQVPELGEKGIIPYEFFDEHCD